MFFWFLRKNLLHVDSLSSRLHHLGHTSKLYPILPIYVLCIIVCTLGLTPWNLSCFESKFNDTRLSTFLLEKLNWDSQQGRDLATSGRNKKNSIGPTFFLYYEESLVSTNLNSKQLRFNCFRPNADAMAAPAPRQTLLICHTIIVLLCY